MPSTATLTLDLLHDGPVFLRGDVICTPERAYYVIRARRVNLREREAAGKYRVCVLAKNDAEPELVKRLLRSADRRGGSAQHHCAFNESTTTGKAHTYTPGCSQPNFSFDVPGTGIHESQNRALPLVGRKVKVPSDEPLLQSGHFMAHANGSTHHYQGHVEVRIYASQILIRWQDDWEWSRVEWWELMFFAGLKPPKLRDELEYEREQALAGLTTAVKPSKPLRVTSVTLTSAAA